MDGRFVDTVVHTPVDDPVIAGMWTEAKLQDPFRLRSRSRCCHRLRAPRTLLICRGSLADSSEADGSLQPAGGILRPLILAEPTQSSKRGDLYPLIHAAPTGYASFLLKTLTLFG